MKNNGKIFVNTNKFNNKTFNLFVGEDIRLLFDLLEKSKAIKPSRALINILRGMYGSHEKNLIEKINSQKKEDGLTHIGWSKRYLPQHLLLTQDEFCNLEVKDRVHYVNSVRKTTSLLMQPLWLINGCKYIFEDGQKDWSWSIPLVAALMSVKDYINETNTHPAGADIVGDGVVAKQQ